MLLIVQVFVFINWVADKAAMRGHAGMVGAFMQVKGLRPRQVLHNVGRDCLQQHEHASSNDTWRNPACSCEQMKGHGSHFGSAGIMHVSDQAAMHMLPAYQ